MSIKCSSKYTNSYSRKCVWKCHGKCRPCCLGLNVLIISFSCQAEYIWANINIYLHLFLNFFITAEMAQVDEVLLYGRQRPLRPAKSMTWWCKDSGHQQSWYWPCSPRIVQLGTWEFKSLCKLFVKSFYIQSSFSLEITIFCDGGWVKLPFCVSDRICGTL